MVRRWYGGGVERNLIQSVLRELFVGVSCSHVVIECFLINYMHLSETVAVWRAALL